MISDLGLRLKVERVRCRLKQKEVAQIVNIDASSISAYETGNVTPPAEILIKLASLYKVTTDYLLGLEKKNTVFTDGLSDEQIYILRQVAGQFIKDNEDK